MVKKYYDSFGAWRVYFYYKHSFIGTDIKSIGTNCGRSPLKAPWLLHNADHPWLLHKLIQNLDVWTLEPLDIAVMVSHHLKLFILKATSIWNLLNKRGVHKSHLPAIGVVGQPGKIDKRSKDSLLTTFLNIKCQIGASLESNIREICTIALWGTSR